MNKTDLDIYFIVAKTCLGGSHRHFTTGEFAVELRDFEVKNQIEIEIVYEGNYYSANRLLGRLEFIDHKVGNISDHRVWKIGDCYRSKM